MATSLLDLIGVVLIGLVAGLLVGAGSGISAVLPTTVTSHIDIVPLAATAAILLLTKTLISGLLSRRIFTFLGSAQSRVVSQLTERLMRMPLVQLESQPSQQRAYALTRGANAAVVMVVGSATTLASEATLLLLLGCVLLVLDPLLTIGAVAFFAVALAILHKLAGNWAGRVGARASAVEIESIESIQEAIASHRELAVLGRKGFYVREISLLRAESASLYADLSFIYLVPKYVLEISLVLGASILAATVFSTRPPAEAVAAVALFLAAASRIMPTLLRMQGAVLVIRNEMGGAQATLDLAHETEGLANQHGVEAEIGDFDATGFDSEFSPTIEVCQVSVTYDASAPAALHRVSLIAKPGERIALVGATGAGKSTFVDVLLGILEPTSGHVDLGGRSPREAICRNPGAIGYVPQSVSLINGTIRENVAFAVPDDLIEETRIWEVLAQVQLDSFLRDARDGLETDIGEGGVRLSGGQKQRIGLARALYPRPKLLVLDEATSALDVETEEAIGLALDALGPEVTLVTVAHRLSTVRRADQVLYLEDGRIVASGSFESVARAVPAFARALDLSGLGRNEAADAPRS